MSLGTAMSYVRWSERKAGVEARVAAAWAAARRRWKVRWMPIVAAVGILAVLVMVGALNGAAALTGILVLMLLTATWPLDSGAILDAISGNAAPARTRLEDAETGASEGSDLSADEGQARVGRADRGSRKEGRERRV